MPNHMHSLNCALADPLKGPCQLGHGTNFHIWSSHPCHVTGMMAGSAACALLLFQTIPLYVPEISLITSPNHFPHRSKMMYPVRRSEKIGLAWTGAGKIIPSFS